MSQSQSNVVSHKNFCYLGLGGTCKFFSEFPTQPVTTRNVFFAFDSENKQLAPIKQRLHDILREYDFELISSESSLIPSGHYFCEKICRPINECAFMIADIGTWDESSKRYFSNPNVTLEVGLAWGMNKKVILMTSTPDKVIRGKKIPSDFYGIEIYFYPKDFFNNNPRIMQVIKEVSRDLLAFNKISFIKSGDEYRKITLMVNKYGGDRLGVHPRFPTITLPEEAVKRRLSILYPKNPQEFQKHFWYWKERKRIWVEKKDSNYVTKAIFNVDSIEDQMKNKNAYYTELTKQDVSQQIDIFTEDLKRKDFHVGLTKEVPRYTFQVCVSYLVWLYAVRAKGPREELSGLLLTTNSAVEAFTKEFNRMWDNIDPKYADKDYIIKWLKKKKKLC